MIWQNPWAFAGLLLLALPVLIHLLSRKRAVLQKFPSLRFLDVTRLLPTRSPNLSDIPLLIVRLGILATAVLALAQPLLNSAARKQSINSTLSRAILIDTSASVARSRPSLDSARTIAERLAADASASVILPTANVTNLVAGANAWLAMQPGRAELVVISDFQGSVVDSAMIARVPLATGVNLVRLPVAGNETVEPWRTTRTTVTATSNRGSTSAEWTDYNAHDPGVTLIELLAYAADLSSVYAARDAVHHTFSPGIPDSLRKIGIVFRRAAEQAQLEKSATTPDAGWMANALLAVRNSDLLASSAASENVSDSAVVAPFTVVATNSRGAPVVYAAQSESKGAKRLVFFNRAEPTGFVSAALIAAVSSAIAQPSTVAESDTSRISEETLRTFMRAPADITASDVERERAASAVAGLSDGRWLWLVALVLLALEWWMRRTAASRDIVLERA